MLLHDKQTNFHDYYIGIRIVLCFYVFNIGQLVNFLKRNVNVLAPISAVEMKASDLA